MDWRPSGCRSSCIAGVGRAEAPCALESGRGDAVVDRYPDGLEPDRIPKGWRTPDVYTTVGATCVGARSALLAWNVYVEGLENRDLREIAAAIRERIGGFWGFGLVTRTFHSGNGCRSDEPRRPSADFSNPGFLRKSSVWWPRRAGRVAETERVTWPPDAHEWPAAQDQRALQRLELGRPPSVRLSPFVAAGERSCPTLFEHPEAPNVWLDPRISPGDHSRSLAKARKATG